MDKQTVKEPFGSHVQYHVILYTIIFLTEHKQKKIALYLSCLQSKNKARNLKGDPFLTQI